MSDAPLAIVAGAGDLPRLIAQHCKESGRPYQVVQFSETELSWSSGHPVIQAEFEKPAKLFDALSQSGCTQITFAGGMQRPKLRVTKFDWKFLKLAPSLLPALKGGDDQTLRVISQIFEAEGLEIIAPNTVLETLLITTDLQTKVQPSTADLADIKRARTILEALGSADVSQGAVVAQGICLGIESIQGTDALLDFVEQTSEGFRPDQNGAKGVLVKLPKSGQDLRIDMPAIGPKTFELAARAGLAGVAVQEGGAMILGQKETIRAADKVGLFLWVIRNNDG